MANKKISQLDAASAVTNMAIPASDSAGTTTSKVTVQSILDAETRWAALLPSAPTNLVGTAGNGQVALTWTAPSIAVAITDYVVQYSSNSGSNWTSFSDGVSTSTSATVTGLSNGTAYIFRVAGVNIIGQGAWSSSSGSVTPEGDPYFSNVELLLHMESFADSSGDPKAVTNVGASISSAQSKFGGSSVSLDGDSYLSIGDTSVTHFSTGDYAVECWVRWETVDESFQGICMTQENGGFGIYWDGGVYGTNVLRVTENNVGDPLSGSFLPSAGQWYHIAAARHNGVSRLYVNGSVIVTNSSDNVDFVAGTLAVGGNGDAGFGVKGWIDDFRVTKGSARGYTGSTISIPTAAFPNS